MQNNENLLKNSYVVWLQEKYIALNEKWPCFLNAFLVESHVTQPPTQEQDSTPIRRLPKVFSGDVSQGQGHMGINFLPRPAQAPYCT